MFTIFLISLSLPQNVTCKICRSALTSSESALTLHSLTLDTQSDVSLPTINCLPGRSYWGEFGHYHLFSKKHRCLLVWGLCFVLVVPGHLFLVLLKSARPITKYQSNKSEAQSQYNKIVLCTWGGYCALSALARMGCEIFSILYRSRSNSLGILVPEHDHAAEPDGMDESDDECNATDQTSRTSRPFSSPGILLLWQSFLQFSCTERCVLHNFRWSTAAYSSRKIAFAVIKIDQKAS